MGLPEFAPTARGGERVIRELDEVRAEAERWKADAEHYRTAIERWHDLGRQLNLNGPDGPTGEWRRAVNALVAIATGENHD